MRGSAHVTVVEPDDEKTASGEVLAELVRPGDHLRPQAHDEHDRRCAGVTEALIRQLDAIGGNPAQPAGGDIVHGRSVARLRASWSGYPSSTRRSALKDAHEVPAPGSREVILSKASRPEVFCDQPDIVLPSKSGQRAGNAIDISSDA